MALRRGCGVVGAVLLGGLMTAAADGLGQEKDKEKPKDKAGDVVVLVDSAGKEIKLTGVKVTGGVRRLAWLADPKGATDDAKKGPLALEVREPNSTTFQKGVVTLVPLASVEAIRYDFEKPAMTVAVKGAAEPLTGTLQYKGINVVGLEGDSGGLAGKFTGGVPKTSFKAVTFPGAKPLPPRPAGETAWAVQIEQPKAGHPALTVRNLKALFVSPGGGEKLEDALPMRKANETPLALSAVKQLAVVAVDPNTQTAVLDVGEGGAEKLVAVRLTREDGKRTGTLVGLVGEVDVGWKLFPLHTVRSIRPAAK